MPADQSREIMSAYALLVADMCNNAQEALDCLNQHYVQQDPEADEATHCHLVLKDMVAIEEEWRARRTADERQMRQAIKISYECSHPEPDMEYLTSHLHFANVGNYDRHPKPWYDLQTINQMTSPNLIPFSYPLNRPNGWGIKPVKKEDEKKPLAPSPPSSPRSAVRLVRYDPPQGHAAVPPPILFLGASAIKSEPDEYDQMIKPNLVQTGALQPGNPGAAFRVNPQVWRGTKQTYRMGGRKNLAYKTAVKSSYPY